MDSPSIVDCPMCGKRFRLREADIEAFECSGCGHDIVLESNAAGPSAEEDLLQAQIDLDQYWRRLRGLRVGAILLIPFTLFFYLLVKGGVRYRTISASMSGSLTAVLLVLALGYLVTAIFVRGRPARATIGFAWLLSIGALVLFVWGGIAGASLTKHPRVMFGAVLPGVFMMMVAIKVWTMVPLARIAERILVEFPELRAAPDSRGEF